MFLAILGEAQDAVREQDAEVEVTSSSFAKLADLALVCITPAGATAAAEDAQASDEETAAAAAPKASFEQRDELGASARRWTRS